MFWMRDQIFGCSNDVMDAGSKNFFLGFNGLNFVCFDTKFSQKYFISLF